MEDGDGEELIWARNELKGMLTALEADLEDLEESVKCVFVIYYAVRSWLTRKSK